MLEQIAKSAPVIFYTKDNHTIELILLKYESASIQDLSFLLRIKTHEDVLVRTCVESKSAQKPIGI